MTKRWSQWAAKLKDQKLSDRAVRLEGVEFDGDSEMIIDDSAKSVVITPAILHISNLMDGLTEPQTPVWWVAEARKCEPDKEVSASLVNDGDLELTVGSFTFDVPSYLVIHPESKYVSLDPSEFPHDAVDELQKAKETSRTAWKMVDLHNARYLALRAAMERMADDFDLDSYTIRPNQASARIREAIEETKEL